MRTEIDIDEALMAEAMAATGLPTREAAVEEALRRLLRNERQKETLALFGTVEWAGDLDRSRRGRGEAA